MDNLLIPKDYFDSSIFKTEMETLFPSCWIFAGLRRDVANDGDWIAVRVGSTAVTVQNNQGELRALHNVCSHRFAVMRTQSQGHGPLQCPYHGWMYDCEGNVSAIPARPRFSDLDQKKMSQMRLRQFRVECCGQLIFIRLTPEGPSLREYCGEVWGSLQSFSEALGSQLHATTLRIAANWKLVIENSLESYHSGCVHPETLGMDRSYRFKIHTGPNFTRYEEQISATVAAKWGRIKKAFSSRPLCLDDYVFYSLFPTFSIDTMRGATFALNVIRPLSLSETELHSRVFATRLSPPELEESALVRAFNDYSIGMAPLVIGQDKAICETVQAGLPQAQYSATLSEEEERILAFQKCYMSQLSASS
ncbi:MAG: aromatic ring-hydroxylating dioxygenase subunit alpha [Methylacidiphilales bacterium]|nr:aromatic ring-hydroxylating dioxygenase subunit alpha [Candidatus Methylacidiphilales bacterium]